MSVEAAVRAPRAARGPVQVRERSLAPDLARGAMLLLIALANGSGVFFAGVPGVDKSPQGLERLHNVFQLTFVNARAIPLFALMFGYGLVQLARRQEGAGSSPGAVRSLLVRRHAWLVAFGVGHGILLYSGDILGAYGLIGLVFALVLLRRGDRVHRFAPWCLGLLAAYVLVLAVPVTLGLTADPTGRATVPTGDFPSATADGYIASVLARLSEWPVSTILLASAYIPVVWLGVWAARRRMLEEPANHRRALRFGAVAGLGVAVLGGLPMGLFAGGYLHVDAATASWIKLLHEVSGVFGGVGYVCVFGLVSLALTRAMVAPRENVVVGALTALGQRSLSGYLFQSVAWLVLVSPFALALGTRVTSLTFTAAGCAIAVWLVTVVGAAMMQRRSYRGPAEILLRRLAYGRRPAAPRRAP